MAFTPLLPYYYIVSVFFFYLYISNHPTIQSNFEELFRWRYILYCHIFNFRFFWKNVLDSLGYRDIFCDGLGRNLRDRNRYIFRFLVIGRIVLSPGGCSRITHHSPIKLIVFIYRFKFLKYLRINNRAKDWYLLDYSTHLYIKREDADN